MSAEEQAEELSKYTDSDYYFVAVRKSPEI